MILWFGALCGTKNMAPIRYTFAWMVNIHLVAREQKIEYQLVWRSGSKEISF